MRAAASNVAARARSWQSQRVTRLSLGALALAGSVLQPVPAHSGQASACVLVNFNPASSILLNSIPLNSTLLKLYYATLLPDASSWQRETQDACVQAVKGHQGCGTARKVRSAFKIRTDRLLAGTIVPRRQFLPYTPLPQPHSGTRGCETGFGRGFSQLTFCPERGKYQPSGFPLSHKVLFSRRALGMKETCEEKL
jgi:hypothetical protein